MVTLKATDGVKRKVHSCSDGECAYWCKISGEQFSNMHEDI